MIELSLLAALLNSRSVYESLKGRLARSDFSDFGQVILKAALAYYRRDKTALTVDRSVLRSALASTAANGTPGRAIADYLDSIPALVDVSAVAGLYRDLRCHSLGLRLADQFGKGEHGDKTLQLVGKYLEVAQDPAEAGNKPRLTVDDLYSTEAPRKKLRVYPAKLNKLLNGGLRPGHVAVIAGRPGSGKTLLTVNMIAGMAHDGAKVLYLCNEEPMEAIQYRIMARLGGVPLEELDHEEVERAKAAFLKAEGRAMQRGLQNIALIHGEFSPDRIEEQIKQHQPQVVVIDQIRHVEGAGEKLTESLEATVRKMRVWGSEHKAAMIGVTQARFDEHMGDNRLVLRMSDIDSSRTGLQGACDLILGLGQDEEFVLQNKRMLSVCRNKVSGKHGAFPVWIDPQYTRVKA